MRNTLSLLAAAAMVVAFVPGAQAQTVETTMYTTGSSETTLNGARFHGSNMSTASRSRYVSAILANKSRNRRTRTFGAPLSVQQRMTPVRRAVVPTPVRPMQTVPPEMVEMPMMDDMTIEVEAEMVEPEVNMEVQAEITVTEAELDAAVIELIDMGLNTDQILVELIEEGIIELTPVDPVLVTPTVELKDVKDIQVVERVTDNIRTLRQLDDDLNQTTHARASRRRKSLRRRGKVRSFYAPANNTLVERDAALGAKAAHSQNAGTLGYTITLRDVE